MTSSIKICAVLILTLADVSYTFSQTSINVKDIDHKKRFFIIQNSMYFEDTARFSIDSIRKTSSIIRFKSIRQKGFKNFGFTSGYYWFRFRMHNSDTMQKSCVLVVGNMIIKEMELFVEDKKGIKSLGKSGINIPLMSRPDISNYFVYPLTIAPGAEATYYLFIDTKGNQLLLSLSLYDLANFKYQGYRLFTILGVFIGIIVLTLLFNLVLFIFNHDRLHIVYSIYALFSILLLMSQENLNSLFFHPDTYFLNQFSRHTIVCLTLFSLFTVMRVFLNQKPGNSRYYRLVTIMLWIYIIIPCFDIIITVYFEEYLFLKKVYWTLLILAIIAGFPIAMLSCIEKLRQGFKPALFYLIAISTPLLGGASMAAILPVHSNYVFRPPTLLEIGLCLESVIICIGILYRYNLYRKQKDSLTLALEKERLASAEQVLLVQEDERKRIAEDLHDELGGTLAAIKMTLQTYNLSESKTQGLVQLIDNASAKARNISHNLMPPEFDDADLSDLLNQYFQQINNEGSLVFSFHCSGAAYSFDKHKELMIYRIILELANNIIRHAEASEATVQLMYYGTYLEVMAEDNGKGFSNNAVDGIGLKNIRSRVSYLSGTITFDSSMNGTTIIIQVPYKTT